MGRGPEGLLHCRLGGGGQGARIWLQSPHPGPCLPRTHSARTARRCNSWSQAGSRCSPGLHSGAGAPCTRGCASAHTPCYRPTTCSTLSTRHRLWGHSTWCMGTHACIERTHSYVCTTQQCMHTHTHTHSAAGKEEPKTHACHQRNPRLVPVQRREHPVGEDSPNRHIRSLTQIQPRAQVYTQRRKPRVRNSTSVTQTCQRENTHQPMGPESNTEEREDCRVSGQVCLAVKGRSTGSLTPGASGAPAWGLTLTTRGLESRPPTPQTAAQSLCRCVSCSPGQNRRSAGVASSPAW